GILHHRNIAVAGDAASKEKERATELENVAVGQDGLRPHLAVDDDTILGALVLEHPGFHHAGDLRMRGRHQCIVDLDPQLAAFAAASAIAATTDLDPIQLGEANPDGGGEGAIALQHEYEEGPWFEGPTSRSILRRERPGVVPCSRMRNSH